MFEWHENFLPSSVLVHSTNMKYMVHWQVKRGEYLIQSVAYREINKSSKRILDQLCLFMRHAQVHRIPQSITSTSHIKAVDICQFNV